VPSIAPAFAAYKLSAVFRCCWACGACGQRSCVVHKSTGLSLHRTQPADKSALAKTAPSDNYPSARPPRLILIDAVLTQIVALYRSIGGDHATRGYWKSFRPAYGWKMQSIHRRSPTDGASTMGHYASLPALRAGRNGYRFRNRFGWSSRAASPHRLPFIRIRCGGKAPPSRARHTMLDLQ
jgi:hypothetical protein